MRIGQLDEANVDAMAALLAAVHRGFPCEEPTSTLGDPAVARLHVQSVIGTGPGVVALDGPSVVGFMVAPPPVLGSSTARLRPHHHAAEPENARLIYRRMYEAISPALLAAGWIHHSVPVPASPSDAMNALFELGFGIDQIKGYRVVPGREELEPLAGPVRAAVREDVDRLAELAIELQQFHWRAPMFQRTHVDRQSIRDGLLRSLDDARSTSLVFEDCDRIVAMLQAEPDAVCAEAVVIGLNVVTETARSAGHGTALLEVLLRWAGSVGYRYCTVGWTSSNLISDAFYRSRGFIPMRYRLDRRLDPPDAPL